MMGDLVWRCGCGFQITICDRRIGTHLVSSERSARIADRLRSSHVLDDADKQLFAHTANGSGRFKKGGSPCGM